MKLCTIGIAMLGDEREFLHPQLIPKCIENLEKTAKIIRDKISY